MDKENYMYTFNSAIKKKEILPFATTWMDLNDIMLSKISQTKKDIWSHLYVDSKKKTPQKELIDTENRLVVAKGEEGVREIGQGVKATNFQL